MLYSRFAGMGIALLKLNRFEEAVAAANRALRQDQTFSTTYRCLAAGLAHLGREDEAKHAVARLLELNPIFAFRSGLHEPVNGNRLSFSKVSAKRDFRNDSVPSCDDVRVWHLSDMAGRADDVCCWGQSRPRNYERRLPKTIADIRALPNALR
jgi:tetratricopeptide (TPR) repeat protein